MSKNKLLGSFGALIISLVLLGMTIICTSLISLRGEYVVTEKRLSNLPYTIGKWTGEDHTFEDSVYKILDADDTLNRHYNSDDNNPLWVFIGYYGTEKGYFQGHVPKYCYPGGGWMVVEIEDMDIPWRSRNTTVQAKKMLFRKGDEQKAVLFWLHFGGDKVLDYGPMLKLNRFWGMITATRSDGAYIRISTPVVNNDADYTFEYEKEFVSHLIELLPACWPIEENKT